MEASQAEGVVATRKQLAAARLDSLHAKRPCLLFPPMVLSLIATCYCYRDLSSKTPRRLDTGATAAKAQ